MKGWQQNLFCILLGIVGSGLILLVIQSPRGESIELVSAPTPSPLIIHVSGSVANPGVYPLPAGSRIADAISAAGGFSEDADQTTINLAEKIRDGEMVLITSVNEENKDAEIAESTSVDAEILLNINTASADELDQLPGIGPAKAQDIISYREINGDFFIIEDIMNVPGIGPSLFEKIQPYILTE